MNKKGKSLDATNGAGGSAAKAVTPFTQLQEQLDRWFSDRFPVHVMTEFPGSAVPRVDAYEHNGSIVVKAELPGVRKDEIDVSLDSGDLVIRGEHKTEEKLEEKSYFRMERSTSSYYRRLPLPEGIIADEVTASLEDGVLTVVLPKPESSRSKQTRIPVV